MKKYYKSLPLVFILISLISLTLGNIHGSKISLNLIMLISIFAVAIYMLPQLYSNKFLLIILESIQGIVIFSSLVLLTFLSPVLTAPYSRITYPIFIAALFLAFIAYFNLSIQDIKSLNNQISTK